MTGGAIEIVLGPSSVGKSTFIVRHRPNATVVLASELGEDPWPTGPFVLHYNSFRPFRNQIAFSDRPLLHDPLLTELTASGRPMSVVYLHETAATIAGRIDAREFIEPDLSERQRPYPGDSIRELVLGIDLDHHARTWVDFFERRSVPVTVFDHDTDEFRPCELPVH